MELTGLRGGVAAVTDRHAGRTDEVGEAIARETGGKVVGLGLDVSHRDAIDRVVVGTHFIDRNPSITEKHRAEVPTDGSLFPPTSPTPSSSCAATRPRS